MKNGRKIIGILLVLISIGALLTWEKWGKKQFLYDEILVLSENTPKGTVITEEMLESVRIDSGENDAIKISDADKIIGRESAFFIHKGVPLFSQYFEEEGLTAGSESGRFVLAIPEEWQISSPQTITKGDRAYFYVGGRFVTSALVFFVSAEEGAVEVVVTDEQAAKLSKIAAQGEGMVLVYN